MEPNTPEFISYDQHFRPDSNPYEGGRPVLPKQPKTDLEPEPKRGSKAVRKLATDTLQELRTYLNEENAKNAQMIDDITFELDYRNVQSQERYEVAKKAGRRYNEIMGEAIKRIWDGLPDRIDKAARESARLEAADKRDMREETERELELTRKRLKETEQLLEKHMMIGMAFRISEPERWTYLSREFEAEKQRNAERASINVDGTTAEEC
jgi:hypothetical protein